VNSFSRYRECAFSDPETIRDIQENLLREHLAYCLDNSSYYRGILERSGIGCKNATLDDLPRLPLTDKSHIERYSEALCAVPPSKIVDIVLSSGTTGIPTRIIYTDHDLKRLAYNEEKSLEGCGITADDTVLLTCTMDRCFIAGLAYFLGIRSIGAAAIRNGLNSLESHAEMILRLSPTAIIGVPTFLRKLGLFLKNRGIDPASTTVTKLVCIGEPLRNKDLDPLPVGESLEDLWRAGAYSTYASSETVTSFCECTARQGGHLNPDLAIVEIIDENGIVLPPGEVGEIVLTPLGMEAMPLIRFQTGDVSFLITEPCSCGRFSPRLGPILGRKKQMMKVRGTTLYPQAIYAALEEMPAVTDYYVVATSQTELSDEITVYAAVKEPSCTAEHIRDKLQARLRVRPAVVIASEEVIKQRIYTPESRKPVFFIDRR